MTNKSVSSKITQAYAGDFNPLKHPLDQEYNLCHTSLKDTLRTGHIPIKLTTVTPLVLLKDDGEERDETKHQTYDVYDRIPEPSLRGMLRSAYEVVSNSRYACFQNDEQLVYRMDGGKKTPKQPRRSIGLFVETSKKIERIVPS